ncbi:hypothetical protein PIB30_006296 [Stylosanthes scabra]|uniref:Ubiquinol-cytochrome C reductase hinge domain-containing protein n=1 Tax=Stylosanthes scabra TaxID=79078 RepID=A0ABU6R5B4_9FABA|nr:hypothetical protein [Stylosanthes scabra]
MNSENVDRFKGVGSETHAPPPNPRSEPPLSFLSLPPCLRIALTTLSLSLLPTLTAMADDEPVDPKRYLEDSCKPKCVKPLLEYQACIKRIDGDDSGHKHCTGQYFDYWSCIDKCVAPKLFPKLK